MIKKLYKLLKEIYIIRTIKRSGLFDKEYYLKNNLDVARSCMNPIRHYVRHGWKEERNPSQYFNTKQYLDTHENFTNANENPLYTYYLKLRSKKKSLNSISILNMRKNKTEDIEPTLRESFQDNQKHILIDKNEQDISKGLISVIIPVYNSAAYLLEVLDSIKNQSYNNTEIIIVDDGSDRNEELLKIVNEYKHKLLLSFYKLEKNSGANYARNYGFSKSHGEYLFFCDSDVILANRIFEKMMQMLQEEPSVSWVYCNYLLGSRELSFFPFEGDRLYNYNFCSTMSLIKRSAFPGFDNIIKRYQDWDLFLTIYENGNKGKWINEFLFYAEDREDGITRSEKVTDYEARAILKEKA